MQHHTALYHKAVLKITLIFWILWCQQKIAEWKKRCMACWSGLHFLNDWRWVRVHYSEKVVLFVNSKLPAPAPEAAFI